MYQTVFSDSVTPVIFAADPRAQYAHDGPEPEGRPSSPDKTVQAPPKPGEFHSIEFENPIQSL